MIRIEAPYLLFLGNATDRLSVKIASSIVDWRPELCIGEAKLPDCAITLGVEELTPAEASRRGAKTLVVSMNNEGGCIDPQWHPTIIDALESGLDVASGLHDRLAQVQAIESAARRNDRQLIDVRHTSQPMRTGTGAKRSGMRLLTVGTDCSVGKMYTALSLQQAMQARQVNCDFVATGQCGIFVSGMGIAIDAVGADFISGAAELLTPDRDDDHWDIIEGQGSLSHPAFAGVSLGLLHGSQADALVLCHAESRSHMRGMPDYRLPELQEAMDINLQCARRTNSKAEFVGISVNTSALPDAEALAVLKRYQDRFSLPCVDPVRTGVDAIAEGLIRPA